MPFELLPPCRVEFALSGSELCPLARFASCSSTSSKEGVLVYEVLRVHAGCMIFAAAHRERLGRSLRAAGVPPSASLSTWWGRVEHLARMQTGTQNLRLEIQVQRGHAARGCAYFVPSSYPTARQLAAGVDVGLLEAVREVPSAKFQNNSLRARANALMAERGLYEVLLVNGEGCITEGSRSNVLFFTEGGIVTPPQQVALPGITRLTVLQVARELSIPVREEEVKAGEIARFMSAAITGTSPGVLPISRIGEVAYTTDNEILRAIMEGYEQKVVAELG